MREDRVVRALRPSRAVALAAVVVLLGLGDRRSRGRGHGRTVAGSDGVRCRRRDA